MYMYYYGYCAGIFDPNTWGEELQPAMWCIASGDDTVAWVETSKMKLLEE